MYSDEEDDFSSPDEGSDSEPMLGKCRSPETLKIQEKVCLFSSVVDPHCIQCGSGSSFLSQYGSGSRELNQCGFG